MIYSLFRFVNKGQKWVKKSVILGVNGLISFKQSIQNNSCFTDTNIFLFVKN